MHEDRRKRVLIIEDEASIGLMVAEILADEGFGVIGPVGNRREALSALEDRQPHAAVLDLGLEDGFCVGLTRELRARATPFFSRATHETASPSRSLRGCRGSKSPAGSMR
jgi:DNA-binding response OmpR family regulator